ncbi:MAG: GspH/FimT family pseudopilin [bacterium]
MDRPYPPKRERGFTVLEILVTLALVSTTITAVVPGFRSTLVESRLTSTGNSLMHSLLLARSEAVMRNTRITIKRIDNDWRKGWIVFEDSNNNAMPDSFEEVLLQHEALADNVWLEGNTPVRDYVSYTENGQAEKVSGAIQMGTLSLCMRDSRHKTLGERKIILSSAGRARVEKKQRTENAVCGSTNQSV